MKQNTGIKVREIQCSVGISVRDLKDLQHGTNLTTCTPLQFIKVKIAGKDVTLDYKTFFFKDLKHLELFQAQTC